MRSPLDLEPASQSKALLRPTRPASMVSESRLTAGLTEFGTTHVRATRRLRLRGPYPPRNFLHRIKTHFSVQEKRAMTTSALFMILAIAVGAGTSQSILSDSSTSSTSTKPPSEPEDNCWINGTWYNPCPGDSPRLPDPPPEIVSPS